MKTDGARVVAHTRTAARCDLRLSLSDVLALRASMPRTDRKSAAQLLRHCHQRLHGSDCPAEAPLQLDEQQRLSFSNLFTSAPVQKLRRMAGAAGETARQKASFIFNFATGEHEFVAEDPAVRTVHVRLRGGEGDGDWNDECKIDARRCAREVVAGLKLQAGTELTAAPLCPVHFKLRGLRSATPRTAPLHSRVAAAKAAAMLEIGARLTVESGRVNLRLCVGGLEALNTILNFDAIQCDAAPGVGAPKRDAAPARQSALTPRSTCCARCRWPWSTRTSA